MDKKEIIRRLEKISGYAVHAVGEPPFIMSLDDGIALNEAIALLKEQEGYVSVPFSWLVKFCKHIDFIGPLTDAEREIAWRKKLWQQFGIDAPEKAVK